MSFLPLPANYPHDTDGFPLSLPGAQFKFSAPVTYQTSSGTGVFFLPNNVEILLWWFQVGTAFNAGTTNTLDVGVSGAQTQFAAALALTGANTVILNGFLASQTFTRIPGPTAVTVRYNQTGTAATAGSGILAVAYMLR